MLIRADKWKVVIFAIFVAIVASVHDLSAEGGKYASVNGLKMYYEMRGSGSPLVLIHGGGSTIGTTFGTVLPQFTKTHKVIAVELQAHGHTSDRDADESFDQDADDVAELIKQLGVNNADILGFSNGGNTAMKVAMRHPDRVRRLIITSAFFKREGIYDGFWKMMENAKFADMPQIYKDEYLKITRNPAGLVNMFNKDARRMQTFKDWSDEDLKSIGASALIIVGDRDVVRSEHAVEMFRLIKNSRLAILPGTHGSFLGEAMSRESTSKVPDLFVALVDEFLRDPDH